MINYEGLKIYVCTLSKVFPRHSINLLALDTLINKKIKIKNYYINKNYSLATTVRKQDREENHQKIIHNINNQINIFLLLFNNRRARFGSSPSPHIKL